MSRRIMLCFSLLGLIPGCQPPDPNMMGDPVALDEGSPDTLDVTPDATVEDTAPDIAFDMGIDPCVRAYEAVQTCTEEICGSDADPIRDDFFRACGASILPTVVTAEADCRTVMEYVSNSLPVISELCSCLTPCPMSDPAELANQIYGGWMAPLQADEPYPGSWTEIQFGEMSADGTLPTTVIYYYSNSPLEWPYSDQVDECHLVCGYDAVTTPILDTGGTVYCDDEAECTGLPACQSGLWQVREIELVTNIDRSPFRCNIPVGAGVWLDKRLTPDGTLEMWGTWLDDGREFRPQGDYPLRCIQTTDEAGRYGFPSTGVLVPRP